MQVPSPPDSLSRQPSRRSTTRSCRPSRRSRSPRSPFSSSAPTFALDHMQLFTGNYYSGGPPTWNSDSYNPSNSNPSQLSITPQLFSIASEVATPSDQAERLRRNGEPFFPFVLRQLLDLVPPSDLRPGRRYRRLAYRYGHRCQLRSRVWRRSSSCVTAQLVASGDVFNFRNTFALMGAGRLEELLEGYDSTNHPIPSRTWSVLLSTLQHRMEATAGKTAKPKSTKK